MERSLNYLTRILYKLEIEINRTLISGSNLSSIIEKIIPKLIKADKELSLLVSERKMSLRDYSETTNLILAHQVCDELLTLLLMTSPSISNTDLLHLICFTEKQTNQQKLKSKLCLEKLVL